MELHYLAVSLTSSSKLGGQGRQLSPSLHPLGVLTPLHLKSKWEPGASKSGFCSLPTVILFNPKLRDYKWFGLNQIQFKKLIYSQSGSHILFLYSASSTAHSSILCLPDLCWCCPCHLGCHFSGSYSSFNTQLKCDLHGGFLYWPQTEGITPLLL